MPRDMLPLAVFLRSSRRCAGVAVAMFALLACLRSPAGAGEQGGRDDATAVMAPAVPERLLAQLLLLSDDACEVRYVPGTLDRAAHVETWLRGLAFGAARRTDHPARLGALVLGPEEWQAARLPCPYGVPCRVGERIMAIPASGDASTVSLWRGVLGSLPALSGVPLMGTAEEAASLAPADSLAGLVVSRDLVTAAGFGGDEPWIVDLLAHALSLDAALQARSGRAEDLISFWGAVRRRGGPLGTPSSDPLILELRRQARLFFSAQAILGSSGKLPLRTLRKLQEKGNGVLRGADLRTTWRAELSGPATAQ